MNARRLVAIPLAAVALALAACASAPDPMLVAENSKLPYPKAAAYGPDLDIVVQRSGRSVTLLNRTAHSYRDVQLWLNQRYVGKAPRIEVGDGSENTWPLNEFISFRGDSFPVGGFLTPEKGFPVVLAELFDPASGLRHRLLVRRD